MKDAYERVSEKNNIPNPLSKRILKRLNWDKTMFGMIEKKLDSKAKETAVGRITEALVQLYGGWKAVGSSANKITDKMLYQDKDIF